MTWRVLRAFAPRFRWIWVMAVPVSAFVWLATVPELAALPAFPPVIFAFTGAALAFGVFWSRETRVLPLSRQELWRMTWCSAVVAPMLIFLVIRLLAMAPEAAMVQAAHEFVYLGVAVAAMPWLMAGGASARRSERMVNHGLFVVMLGWIALPFLVGRPPTTFAAMPPRGLVLLGCGLLVAIIPLFRTPRSIGRRSHGVANARVRAPLATWDGVSGLTRLVPGQVGTAVGICVSVCGLQLLPILILGGPSSGGGSLEAAGLLPFVPDRPNSDVLLKSGVTMYLAVFVSSGLTDYLRQLRLLPITTWQLVALISSGPAVIAATLWAVLASVHALAMGQVPVDPRGALFLFIVGFGTLLNAVRLRRRSFALLVLVPTMILLPRLPELTNSAFGLPALGLLMFVSALALNHRTITRAASSSSTYRPISQIFGIGLPQSPR